MNAWDTLLMVLLIVVAVFMILLILVQRGRGGGLTGALGGMGGQSAFGAKAGDTFTKITMWTALVWILLCIVGVKFLSSQSADLLGPRAQASDAKGAGDAMVAPTDKTKTAPGKTGAGTVVPNDSQPPPTPMPPAKSDATPAKTDAPPAKTDAAPAKTDAPAKADAPKDAPATNPAPAGGKP